MPACGTNRLSPGELKSRASERLWRSRRVAEISAQTRGHHPAPQMVALIRVHIPHRVGDLFLDCLERQKELFRTELSFPRVARGFAESRDKCLVRTGLAPSRSERGTQLLRHVGGEETPVVVRRPGIVGNHHDVKVLE